MAVAAELVVGRHDVGPVAAHQPDQAPDGLVEVRLPVRAGVAVPDATDHVRVAVPEVVPLGHAELGHRCFHLGGPQLAEAPVVVGRVQLGDDDLAHLAPRAGDDHHPMAGRDGLGERATHAHGLVVGVGVDRHQGVVVGGLREVRIVHGCGLCALGAD